MKHSQQRMLGKYEIHKSLGRGGMGEILLAKDTSLGTDGSWVVLKCLLPELTGNEEAIALLEDEAELLSRFSDRSIIKLHRQEIIDQRHVLVLEYVAGRDLQQVIMRSERIKAVHDNPPYRLHAQLLAQVASALHLVHTATNRQGESLQIIHRDISPANILVGYDGYVRLLDFGIAKSDAQEHETEAGQFRGRFQYMSPEQAQGEPLDQRSDLFSLGIVFYELMTGVHPYAASGGPLAALRAIMLNETPLPSTHRPDFPPQLQDIIMALLTSEPEKRIQTAEALLYAVRAYLQEDEVKPRSVEIWMDSLFEKEKRNIQNLMDSVDTAATCVVAAIPQDIQEKYLLKSTVKINTFCEDSGQEFAEVSWTAQQESSENLPPAEAALPNCPDQQFPFAQAKSISLAEISQQLQQTMEVQSFRSMTWEDEKDTQKDLSRFYMPEATKPQEANYSSQTELPKAQTRRPRGLERIKKPVTPPKKPDNGIHSAPTMMELPSFSMEPPKVQSKPKRKKRKSFWEW